MARLNFQAALAPGGILDRGTRLVDTIFTTKLQRAQIEDAERKEQQRQTIAAQQAAAEKAAAAQKAKLQEHQISTDAFKYGNAPLYEVTTVQEPVRDWMGKPTGEVISKQRSMRRQPTAEEALARENEYRQRNGLPPLSAPPTPAPAGDTPGVDPRGALQRPARQPIGMDGVMTPKVNPLGMAKDWYNFIGGMLSSSS